MNPVAAMINPVMDPAMAASAAPGGATDDTAGFADALQRAGGSPRPEPASSGEAGPSRTGRDAVRESPSARGSKRPPESVSSPRDEVDETSQGAEARMVRDIADEHADAKPEHDSTAQDQDGEAPALVAVPDAGLPRSGVPSRTDSGLATHRHVAGSDEVAPGDAPAPGGSPKAKAMQAGVDPATVDETPAESAPTAAMNAAEAARRVAGQQAIVPATEGAQPVGVQRRSGGSASTIDPASRGTVAGTAPDAAVAQRVAAAARASGIGRAAQAPVGDQSAAATSAEAGPKPDFGEALLASLAPDTDPRAGIAASAATSFPMAGGPRPVALPIAAPVHSPAFSQALGQQLTVALRMDLGQAELILSPAELGPVRVELSLEGDTASVHFAATHPETRQALEQSLPNLRTLFAEQGLSLAHTHVGPGFHRDGGGRPTPGVSHRATDGRSGVTIDGDIRPTGARIRPDALVDLFA